VADAAVVSSSDDHTGEAPVAIVVRRRFVSPAELIGWVAEQVAPYPRIRSVEFVDHIPRSRSGKIGRPLRASSDRRPWRAVDDRLAVAVHGG